MGKPKRAFQWKAARGIVLAAWTAGGCLALSSLAKAQITRASQVSLTNSRLLGEEEGRAIADAALNQDLPVRGMRDCSHLVHETYVNAGFEYPYASSFELYAGSENFVRVRHPQPGDLVVWPGHVGIVLDPGEHRFYSLVSTGLETQDYQGPYWSSRGKPRFYRYKMENGGVLTAARVPASSRTFHSGKPHDEETVTGERSPAVSSDPNRPPKTASERTKAVNTPTDLPAPDVERTTFDFPQSIVIAPGSKQPTNIQVAEGISELCSAYGMVLRADDPSRLALPVVIFERLHVERLEIKKDHGWARLQIDSRATIAGGETDYKRRREKIRWELRRTESGWEAITPTDRTYVPNDVAVRNLAAQLARLTEGDGAAAHQETVLRQESQLANLLSALLENK